MATYAAKIREGAGGYDDSTITVTNGQIGIKAGGVGSTQIASNAVTADKMESDIALTPSTVVASVGVQATATAVVPTADGTGAGLIPANTSFAAITSTNAEHQVTLPAAVPGTVIDMAILGATACELIATGASVKINDVICGATNEALLLADSWYRAICLTSTEWILIGWDKLGAVITATIPDAR